MEIQYKYKDESITAKEFFDLLAKMETGKNDRFPAHKVFHLALRNLQKEQQSINNSLNISARLKDGTLVGYARIMTDYTYVYYITDVMVDPAYQGKGIGKALMNLCIEESKKGGFIKILLTSMPDKIEFYEKLNFKPVISPVVALRGEDYLPENK